MRLGRLIHLQRIDQIPRQRLAEQAGIPGEIALDIPDNLNVDALELSMVVSNLMETRFRHVKGLQKSGFLSPLHLPKCGTAAA